VGSSSSLVHTELLPGQLLLEKYLIVRQVGEGGFGRVYEAEQVDVPGRPRVALKLGRGPEHSERMMREARLAALLKSPHSVRVFGVDRLADGSPLIVMELLEGLSLREYIVMRGRVPLALALEWSLQLCAALREAHGIGLVHRDLKPSNIFLAETDQGSREAKLLDFGLARAPGWAGEFTVTGSDLVLGSPAYMSPEQIRCGEVTNRSDIWAFGVVFQEMITGRRPFYGDNNAALLAAIAADPPEALTTAAPGLARPFYQIAEGCLRKDPEERFANVDQLIALLLELHGSEVRVSPDPSADSTETASAVHVPQPGVSAARPPRNLLGLWPLAVAVAVVGIVWALPKQESDRPVAKTPGNLSLPLERATSSAAPPIDSVAQASKPVPPSEHSRNGEGESTPKTPNSHLVDNGQRPLPKNSHSPKATQPETTPRAPLRKDARTPQAPLPPAPEDSPIFVEPDF
jgi:eukaryotic-like serine/threonine-protein kinase